MATEKFTLSVNTKHIAQMHRQHENTMSPTVSTRTNQYHMKPVIRLSIQA